MTNKKRRARGSRTHGGGTHKNRRGAGHRGGRGNAGRSKHEFHNHEPLGKYGFKRHQDAQAVVETVNVRELDENAALYAADGLAETTDDGYRIDVYDVVEDAVDADYVKVLGGGSVRQPLVVVADAFSDSAVDGIETAGGEVVLTDLGEELAAEPDDEPDDEPEE